MIFNNQTLPVSRDTVNYAKFVIEFTETAISNKNMHAQNLDFQAQD